MAHRYVAAELWVNGVYLLVTMTMKGARVGIGSGTSVSERVDTLTMNVLIYTMESTHIML
jgi:hypothetical protein